MSKKLSALENVNLLELKVSPRYEASDDLWIEVDNAQWLASGEWDCLHSSAQKLAWVSKTNVKKNYT